ncbi:hypothetical protein D3C84_923630 [compost metagenome]
MKHGSRRAEHGPDLAPNAGGGQSVRGELHEVASPGDIAARRGDAAAGVFDQRAGHQIDANLRRLFQLGELPIAIVYEDNQLGVDLFDKSDHFTDLGNRERRPPRVAA